MMIASLPDMDEVTLDDEESVEYVREYVDNLTEEQRAIVTKLAMLEVLETSSPLIGG